MKPEHEPIPKIVRTLRVANPKAALALRAVAASEIMSLRRLLACAHGITYGDDGELQSHEIDFARDTVAEIEAKLDQRGMKKLAEWIKANPEEAERLGYKFHSKSLHK